MIHVRNVLLVPCMPLQMPSHEHEIYELHFIIKGKAFYKTEKRPFHLEAGNISITLPGERHSLVPAKESIDTAQYIVFFEILGSEDELLRKQIHHFRATYKKIFIGLEKIPEFSQIHHNRQLQCAYHTKALEVSFASILYSAHSQKKSMPNWLNLAIQEMHHNIHSNINIEQICLHIQVSASHLSREFKHHFGRTPLQYFQSLKIHMAKSYLTEKNLTIYQISDLLGYANEFHFSRSFKKHTNISPSAYRNSTKIGETIPNRYT